MIKMYTNKIGMILNVLRWPTFTQ